MNITNGKINIMLDLETLGKKPGCKILTISACTFSTKGIANITQFFDCAVRIDTQDLLKVDQDTVDWWAKQGEEARKAAFESVKAITLVKALAQFSDWLTEVSEDSAEPVIWGKGATFDAPILAAAYEAYQMDIPWNFRNERCYRTLEAEFKDRVKTPEFIGTKHTSLADAVYQAKYAQAIFETMYIPAENSNER